MILTDLPTSVRMAFPEVAQEAYAAAWARGKVMGLSDDAAREMAFSAARRRRDDLLVSVEPYRFRPEKGHAPTYSADDVQSGLRRALKERFAPGQDQYIWVADWGDTWVAFQAEGMDGEMLRLGYTLGADGVTLAEGEPDKVMSRTTFVPVETSKLQPERAFVITTPQRTFITGLAHVPEQAAFSDHPGHLYLAGRYVGAEKANRNNAFWTTEDLSLGEPTVRHGPLNWLHDGSQLMGCLTDAKLIRPSLLEAAAEQAQPHIAAASVMWAYLFPEQAKVVESSSRSGHLWQSMECVSKTVACRDYGCVEVEYAAWRKKEGLCEHLNDRSGAVHFKEPIFLGAGLIVPPVKPGWVDAHVSVMVEAASYAEKAYEQAGRPDLPASEFERVVAAVLSQAA